MAGNLQGEQWTDLVAARQRLVLERNPHRGCRMPNLIGKAKDFYNSETGRKLVNWGTTTLGLLLTSGVLPMDMPIGPLSLGQLITILGLRLPSTPPVKPGALKL